MHVVCLQALFFGDFLLCQQKKVTRPPGRDPAAAQRATNQPSRKRTAMPATLGGYRPSPV